MAQENLGLTSTPSEHHLDEAMVPQLLALPPELRNRIYDFVLTDTDPIAITPTSFASHTALTQTFRQIRTETKDIFYTRNNFPLTSAKDELAHAAAWLFNISSAQGLLIREIIIAPTLHEGLDAEAFPTPKNYDTEGALYGDYECALGDSFKARASECRASDPCDQ